MRRFLFGTANSKFESQNSELQNRLQLAKAGISGREKWASAGRSCGPRRLLSEAANSRFKIKKFCRACLAYLPIRAAACGGRNDAEGLRASAAGRLRPAAVPFGTANSAFKIQDSKLKDFAGHAWHIFHFRAAACGVRNDAEELRASAAPRLRPAVASRRTRSATKRPVRRREPRAPRKPRSAEAKNRMKRPSI